MSLLQKFSHIHNTRVITEQPEWGGVESYYSGAVDWARENLEANELLIGANRVGYQMLPFEIFRNNPDGNLQLNFALPSKKRIQYSEDGGKIYDRHDKMIKRIVPCFNPDGGTLWLVEGEYRLVLNPQFLELPSASMTTLWEQICTMAHPYCSPYSINFARKVTERIGTLRSGRVQPGEPLLEVFNYLREYRKNWSQNLIATRYRAHDCKSMIDHVVEILSRRPPYYIALTYMGDQGVVWYVEDVERIGQPKLSTRKTNGYLQLEDARAAVRQLQARRVLPITVASIKIVSDNDFIVESHRSTQAPDESSDS